jgi:hypothetical protein
VADGDRKWSFSSKDERIEDEEAERTSGVTAMGEQDEGGSSLT